MARTDTKSHVCSVCERQYFAAPGQGCPNCAATAAAKQPPPPELAGLPDLADFPAAVRHAYVRIAAKATGHKLDATFHFDAREACDTYSPDALAAPAAKVRQPHFAPWLKAMGLPVYHDTLTGAYHVTVPRTPGADPLTAAPGTAVGGFVVPKGGVTTTYYTDAWQTAGKVDRALIAANIDPEAHQKIEKVGTKARYVYAAPPGSAAAAVLAATPGLTVRTDTAYLVSVCPSDSDSQIAFRDEAGMAGDDVGCLVELVTAPSPERAAVLAVEALEEYYHADDAHHFATYPGARDLAWALKFNGVMVTAAADPLTPLLNRY